MTALLALALSACPARTVWPTPDWADRIADTRAARATEIKALEDYAFTLTGTDDERLGIRTDAVLIIKGGELIYEKYGRGYGPKNRHISWSVAKSYSTAIAGVAVNKGALAISDPICKYLKGCRDDQQAITVQNLMEFGSGMHWQEAYENETYQYSSVIAMIFGEGHHDYASFILAHKQDHAPGAVWQYSTGEATLLAEVARQAGEAKLGKDWMWTELFRPTGMSSVVIEGDEKGAPMGGGWVFATPRDFARFGYLYLNDGCFSGTRYLPDGWVFRSIAMSQTFRAGASADQGTPNGWMWWNNEVPPKRTERPWPDAPADTFLADGHWGQFIIVIPSRDLVIVRTGDDRNDGISINELIKLSLEVAR